MHRPQSLSQVQYWKISASPLDGECNKVRTDWQIICLPKEHTSGEALDHVIQSAIAVVGMLPKEDGHRPC